MRGAIWLTVALASYFVVPALGQGFSPPAYRLQPGDVVTIVVLGEPDLSGEMLIGPDGYLRLPLVGSLRAAGLTLDELTARLEGALRKYLRAPRVTVALKKFSPLFSRVYVMGEVKMPGAYPIAFGGATVFDAIAAAGGFTPEADLRRVQIFHNDGRISTVNLQGFDMRDSAGADRRFPLPFLNPGDVVWVPPSFVRVAIVGAVAQPGVHPVPFRATLLEALALAGGVQNPEALIRVYRNGTELLRASWRELMENPPRMLPLQRGDTIVVSVKEVRGIIVTGAVANPGVLNLPGDVTLLGALAFAGFPIPNPLAARVRLIRDGKVIKVVPLDPAKPPPIQDLETKLKSGDIVAVEPMVLRATIVGPVKAPGTYELPKGAKVLDLLAKGGELLPTADLSEATLIRRGERRKINLLGLLWEGDMEANLPLKDGDTLVLTVSRRVWVVGAVQRPGTVDFQPHMTVMDAIGAAGGPMNLLADLSAVRVVSGGKVRIVNLEKAFKGQTVLPEPIKPGDVIIVPERGKAYVYGAVFRSGAVPVHQDDTALTILSNAGGPLPNADLSKAVLVRFTEGQPIVMKLDLSRALQKGDLSQAPIVRAGDVLYIPPKKRRGDWRQWLGVLTGVATALYYLSIAQR